MTSRLPVRDGVEVVWSDRRIVIRQVLGFDTVVAEDAATGQLERLAIAELGPFPVPDSPAGPVLDLTELDDRDWEEARRRLELVGPLIDGTPCPRAVVLERARAANCDVTTLYRWAKLYRASGLLSSLLGLPSARDAAHGRSRRTPRWHIGACAARASGQLRGGRDLDA